MEIVLPELIIYMACDTGSNSGRELVEEHYEADEDSIDLTDLTTFSSFVAWKNDTFRRTFSQRSKIKNCFVCIVRHLVSFDVNPFFFCEKILQHLLEIDILIGIRSTTVSMLRIVRTASAEFGSEVRTSKSWSQSNICIGVTGGLWGLANIF